MSVAPRPEWRLYDWPPPNALGPPVSRSAGAAGVGAASREPLMSDGEFGEAIRTLRSSREARDAYYGQPAHAGRARS